MLQIQPEHIVAFTQRCGFDREIDYSCLQELFLAHRDLLWPHDWVRDLVAGIGLRKSNRSDPLTLDSAADYPTSDFAPHPVHASKHIYLVANNDSKATPNLLHGAVLPVCMLLGTVGW